MTDPLDDTADLAEDQAIARMIRERSAAGASRPLAEMVAEMGIIFDELGSGGQGSSAMDVRETVRLLNSALGATLVSTLAGSHDPTAAHLWAQEGDMEPDTEAVERLLLAHRIWVLVSNSEGNDFAREWFIGANHWLGDTSPVEAISRLESERVIIAAQAIADGTFAG